MFEQLKPFLRRLLPVTETHTITTWNGSFQTAVLNIPNNINLILDEESKDQRRSIAKIYCIVTHCHPHWAEKREAWRAHRVVIVTRTGEILIMKYPLKTVEDLKKFHDFFKTLILSCKADYEIVFTRPDIPVITQDERDYFDERMPSLYGVALDWSSPGYSREEERFYRRARPLLLNALKKFSKQDTVHSVISVGCGKGECLLQAINVFRPALLIGMDVVEESLDIAFKKVVASLKIGAKVKDSEVRCLAIKGRHDELIEVQDGFPDLQNPDLICIGFASGCLTRQVHNGTWSSAHGLQQAFRVCHAFGVLGLDTPLMSLEILRRIGWMSTLQSYSLDEKNKLKEMRSLYLMRRPTAVEMRSHLRTCINQGILNLSLNADPYKYLQAIESEEAKSIKTNCLAVHTLNLRFAYFKNKEEFNLFIILARKLLPQVRTIIAESDDQWLGWIPKNLTIQNVPIKLQKLERPIPKHELPMLEASVPPQIYEALTSNHAVQFVFEEKEQLVFEEKEQPTPYNLGIFAPLSINIPPSSKPRPSISEDAVEVLRNIPLKPLNLGRN